MVKNALILSLINVVLVKQFPNLMILGNTAYSKCVFLQPEMKYRVSKMFSLQARPTVLLIMLNNAAIGIVTSFFLKNLNSILKTFASALELMFTAVFCWLIFGIPIHLSTVAAIAVVSYSVLLYSQNPVVNQTPTSTSAQSKEPLLPPSQQV
jgi:drug/metabolite transporter (DMT)-like permease